MALWTNLGPSLLMISNKILTENYIVNQVTSYERISYAFQILLIGVTAVAISFALYTVMWLILNDTIYQITGRGDLIGQVTLGRFF